MTLLGSFLAIFLDQIHKINFQKKLAELTMIQLIHFNKTHAPKVDVPSPSAPQELLDALSSKLSLNIGDTKPLFSYNQAADSAQKFLIRDTKGENRAVVHYSTTYDPLAVQDMICRVYSARQAIGSDLEAYILNPLEQGDLEGLSYGVFNYQKPLAKNKIFWLFQRVAIAPHLLEFLIDLVKVTKASMSSEQIEERFGRSLQSISTFDGLSGSIQTAAKESLQRLEQHLWTPRTVLMHGDLWRGNVLLTQPTAKVSSEAEPSTSASNKSTSNKIVLIDWAASLVHGYAIFDLVRMAESFGLSPKQLRKNLEIHCQILGCDVQDSKSYLLSAMGHIGRDLRHFPVANFLRMCESTVTTLDKALGL